MNFIAIIAAMHITASNHGAGVEFSVSPRAIEPVPVHMPTWQARETKPAIVTSDNWTARAVHHIPARAMR